MAAKNLHKALFHGWKSDLIQGVTLYSRAFSIHVFLHRRVFVGERSALKPNSQTYMQKLQLITKLL